MSLFNAIFQKEKTITVIGLGYVGLPLALEFAKYFKVIGFDINTERVALMQRGIDPSNELDTIAFDNKDISFTTNIEDIKNASFYVVAVPTPVDNHKNPDLTPLIKSSQTIGKVLKRGDYVVYESTVYPGCTEEDCVTVLEQVSGLKAGIDFKFGYSPERINPGDKLNTIDKIVKIVSGNDEEALENIAALYGTIITAGIYKAKSVKVAEAAKVVENTQRDLNISLMNELSIIFQKIGIHTHDVIEAAATKWNFLKFYPGLVGGHCIGVDPYYLTYKAKQLGYDPEVILSGRRINDGMPAFIAKKAVQLLIKKANKAPQEAKILVMGITFKENVSDIRNSKVAEFIQELRQYNVVVDIVDPHASSHEVAEEYSLILSDTINNDYDLVVVAVNHQEYVNLEIDYFKSIMNNKSPILIDIKSIFLHKNHQDIEYWTL